MVFGLRLSGIGIPALAHIAAALALAISSNCSLSIRKKVKRLGETYCKRNVGCRK